MHVLGGLIQIPRTLIRTALWVAILSSPVRAQEIVYGADSAKMDSAKAAGVGLIHWVETIWHAREHIIYVRNISSRPLRVESFEIYDCFGLRRKVCGVHTPGPRLAPGETKRLIIIDEEAAPGQRSSYRYRVKVAADSTVADSSHH